MSGKNIYIAKLASGYKLAMLEPHIVAHDNLVLDDIPKLFSAPESYPTLEQAYFHAHQLDESLTHDNPSVERSIEFIGEFDTMVFD